MAAPVRTRFAPSPTGYLHVGGVRTALFAWLVARQGKGQFILRLEDTDKVREVEGSEQHIIDSLSWLGLKWDEGPDKGGAHGPYRQSERLATYKQWAEKLLKTGRAYADTHTPESLDELRAEAKQQKQPFLFRDHRPTNPPTWDGSQPLRFKSEPKAYQWHDEVMGELSTGPEVVDDFIILKSDGFPTYNFAHIIDDQLMEVTHVIRTQEFLPSVPKFLNLYEALGLSKPRLATLPYVMGPDGRKKLSKRDGAKDILDYRREGYLPEALISFLATLGWNDGSQQEVFSVDELLAKFDLGRVQKSGAKFDEPRLKWINGQLIRQAGIEELTQQATDFWPPEASTVQESYKLQVLKLIQERLKYLSEIPELTKFFFSEPKSEDVLTLYKNPVDKQLKNIELGLILKMLQSAQDTLEQSNFSKEDLSSRLNDLLEKLQTKPGILFATIRIALTGTQSSPELFGTLHVLGKETALKRLQKATSALGN